MNRANPIPRRMRANRKASKTGNAQTDDCYAAVTDTASALERLKLMDECWRILRAYDNQRHAIERCPGGGRLLAERAFAAERSGRVVFAAALECLNELADSGRLAVIFSWNGSSQLSFESAFSGVRKFVSTDPQFEGISTDFLDEAEKQFHEFNVAASVSNGVVLCSFQTPDGRKHKHEIDCKPAPGDLGRISVQQFFSNINGVLYAPSTYVPADQDRHQQSQRISLQPRRTPIYASTLNCLAVGRELMYRHARVADRFGRAHLAGHGFLAPMLLAFIAASLLIAGATIEIGCVAGAVSGNVCNFATGLLLGYAVAGAIVGCVLGSTVGLEVICEFEIDGITMWKSPANSNSGNTAPDSGVP